MNVPAEELPDGVDPSRKEVGQIPNQGTGTGMTQSPESPYGRGTTLSCFVGTTPGEPDHGSELEPQKFSATHYYHCLFTPRTMEAQLGMRLAFMG